MSKFFSDVLTIVNGKNQRAVENPNGKYPIYGSGGIMGYADNYLCDAETVIIGRKGSINKPIFVEEPFWNVDTAFGLVANKTVLLPKYLFYFCVNYDFEKLNKTVTIPSLTKSDLLKIDIDIPSIIIQESVVKKLDSVEKCIELYQMQLQKLDELIKSRFVEMFGDPVINPRSININPWKDIFFTQTGKLDSNEAAVNGKYPFFTCSKEPLSINEYAYDCEALLLAGNNAAGIYDVKHYKGKFNAYQRTYILQLQNKEWEYAVFKHQLEDKLLFLQSQSKGTNTRYLTMGILNQLSFLVPPIKLQNRFADFVTQVEKQKATIQQSIDKLETLKKSLMQEYFG